MQNKHKINAIYKAYSDGLLECKDGNFTDSTKRGFCSHHRGIASDLDNISDTDVESLFYKDFYIAEYLQNSKIRIEDFYRYGGRKSDVKHKLHWFSKNSTPLDIDAAEISSSIGVEVDPEEIIDIVQSYGSGKEFMTELRWNTLEFFKKQAGIHSIVHSMEGCL